MRQPKLWIWNWKAGSDGFVGYNSCLAHSRAEAIRKATGTAGKTVLVLDEATLHRGSYGELRALDAKYAGMFD